MGRQKAKKRREKMTRSKSGSQYAAWKRRAAAMDAQAYAQRTNGCELWQDCQRAKRGACEIPLTECDIRLSILEAEEKIRSGDYERYNDDAYTVRTKR
ncbi:MAG: hypothetical protein IJ347_03200 [Faecalibacterium sp.]|nr:hypothetical protein [Faecalibacterium sp.]